ncbi:hypothetical protein D3C76_1239110 [compost metagenome]
MLAQACLHNDAFRAIALNQSLFVLAVNPQLLGYQHSRSHQDGIRPHHQRRRQLASGTNPATDNHRDGNLFRCMGCLNHAADAVGSWMAAAVVANDDHRVHAKTRG